MPPLSKEIAPLATDGQRTDGRPVGQIDDWKTSCLRRLSFATGQTLQLTPTCHCIRSAKLSGARARGSVVVSILVSRSRRAARSGDAVLEVGDLPFVSNRSTSTYLDENHNDDNRQLSTATTTAVSAALHYCISTSTASELMTS